MIRVGTDFSVVAAQLAALALLLLLGDLERFLTFPLVVVAGIGLILVIVSGVYAIVRLSENTGEQSVSERNDENISKVSLTYLPEEIEDAPVSSNIQEQVDILGQDNIQETSQTPQSTTSTQTITSPTPTPQPDPPPLTDGSCPVSTLNCVPCKVSDGHWACRYESGAEYGYLGWSCQNNNPGNIR